MLFYRAKGIKLADGIRLLIVDLDIRRSPWIIQVGPMSSSWSCKCGREKKKLSLGNIGEALQLVLNVGEGPWAKDCRWPLESEVERQCLLSRSLQKDPSPADI